MILELETTPDLIELLLKRICRAEREGLDLVETADAAGSHELGDRISHLVHDLYCLRAIPEALKRRDAFRAPLVKRRHDHE